MSESRDYVTLGELADLNPESLGAKTPTDHTFKYIDLTSVSHGSIDMAALEQFRFVDAPSRARRVVRDGDVLFGTVRPRLRSHAKVAGHGYVASTGFCVTRARPGVADGGFLGHFLLSDEATGQAIRREVGSNYPAVTARDVAAFRLPRIPLEEQRRIAEILDTIDEAIQATEGAIAKLRFAHDALQQRLVPARVIDGVEEALLGALVDSKRPIVYGILMPGEHVIGGVPVIKVKDIKNGEIASRQTLLHTSPLIDQQYARSRVQKGDLLFTIRGSVGRTAIVPESHDGANITQDTARIAATGVNRSYLVAVMATERFARFVGVHTIGQAVKGINLRELRRAPIPLIGRNEQEIAGAALDGSIASIGAERERLEKLRLLRTGLAADLLSGRVRTVAA